MKTLVLVFTVILCQYFFVSDSIAAEKPEKEKKQTPFDLYLTATEAYELKQQLGDNAMLVDIRTHGEVMFVGIAQIVDAHIPFEQADYSRWNPKQGQYAMTANPEFLSSLKNRLGMKKLDKGATIILICRSGSRSARAARVLHEQNFKQVYSVVDGFEGDSARTGWQKGQRVVNGWKNAGLPWSYRARKQQLFNVE